MGGLTTGHDEDSEEKKVCKLTVFIVKYATFCRFCGFVVVEVA